MVPPLRVLWERPGRRSSLPLPAALERFHGPLCWPLGRGGPDVAANFASALDGVVSLQRSGHSGGGDFSSFDREERLLMGLLRAAADAVVVGAGTARSVPGHRWTPEHVFPPGAAWFAELRSRLGLSPDPLQVIVSAHGDLPLRHAVFRPPERPVLIVTTAAGRAALRRRGLPPWVRLRVGGAGPALRASSVLRAVAIEIGGSDARLLVEGGPRLLRAFVAERKLNRLFLTVAPQLAGRNAGDHERPTLVEGQRFAPNDPRWGRVAAVRRGASLLFLQVEFPGAAPARRRRKNPGL